MIGAKMEGRKMIAMSRLHLKVKSPDLQSDWVTIGVIVHKSDARKSQTVSKLNFSPSPSPSLSLSLSLSLLGEVQNY